MSKNRQNALPNWFYFLAGIILLPIGTAGAIATIATRAMEGRPIAYYVAVYISVALIGLLFFLYAIRTRRHQQSAIKSMADSEPARDYWNRYWYASLIADVDVPKPNEGASDKEWGEWLLHNAGYAKKLAQSCSLEKLRKMSAERNIQVPELE